MSNPLPTIVVDNFFNDVDKIIKLSKKYKYHPPTKEDYWAGKRSECLHIKNYDLFVEIILKILSYFYPNKKLRFSKSAIYFHKIRPKDKGKSQFHIDGDCNIPDRHLVLAAVIYLSKGSIKTGTTIFNKDNKKQILVSNDFNTMVGYDTVKKHGPTTLNIKEERLTLNVFISNVEFRMAI
tara:strand:+ start:51 stop:590 length:540 start_codon:yes stop_codon:yes gene_type:complete